MAISLSTGVRQSLQSLTSTAALAQTAQTRLATGKRVNSAIDNPTNFFTASSLNGRADSFSALLDGMSNSIQTIKAASTGIDGITKLVKSLQSTVKQARSEALPNAAAASATGAALGGATTAAGALQKTLVGATSAGNSGGGLGFTAGDTISLTPAAGGASYTFTSTAASTVQDLVNGINASGIASASIGSGGELTLSGPSSFTLATSGTTQNDNLGFTNVASTSITAPAPGTSSVRAGLSTQFNETLTQLNQLAKDAGFNGINLLNGDTLKTVFNEKTGSAKSEQTVVGTAVSGSSLGIQSAVSGVSGATTDFQSDAELDVAADALTSALTQLSSLASSLGSSLSVVQTRQEFSRSMIDTLKIGADNLVNADTNEEGANLLALQTRQQLSQTALSLSSQSDQAVLRLF